MNDPRVAIPVDSTGRGGSSADCYAAGDRRIMDWWKRLRARRLSAFLRGLGRVGATADRVTMLGLVSGLGFCVLWAVSPEGALICLALHLLLDGIDGPLAREQGTASRRGSFTDTLCDQIVVATTTITLVLHDLLAPAPALAYVFLYTVAVTFSMLRNALGVPYRWLLRPRLAVYAAIPLDLWLWPGTTHWVVLLSLPCLLLAVVRGAQRLRSRL